MGMKIAVCIKQVPRSQETGMDANHGLLLRGTSDVRLNPYDAAALEAAQQLREAAGGSVTAITMGPLRAEEVLRTAAAMGTDEEILVTGTGFAGADVLATASALADVIRMSGPFDLLLFGKQTTDGDTGQVGPETAQMLSMPCVCYVQSAQYRDKKIYFRRELTGCVQEGSVTLPCALCMEQEYYCARIPSLRQKIKAGKKKPRTVTVEELPHPENYGTAGSATSVVRIFAAANGRKGKQVKGDISENLCFLKTEIASLQSGGEQCEKQ